MCSPLRDLHPAWVSWREVTPQGWDTWRVRWGTWGAVGIEEGGVPKGMDTPVSSLPCHRSLHGLGVPGDTDPCPAWGRGDTDPCPAWGMWDMIPSLPGDMGTLISALPGGSAGSTAITAAAHIPLGMLHAGRCREAEPEHSRRAGVPAGSGPAVIVGLPALNHSLRSRQSSSREVPWRPPQRCTRGRATGSQYPFGAAPLTRGSAPGSTAQALPPTLPLLLCSSPCAARCLLHPFPLHHSTFPAQHPCSQPLSTLQCPLSSPSPPPCSSHWFLLGNTQYFFRFQEIFQL